jgi:hypothetical protein
MGLNDRRNPDRRLARIPGMTRLQFTLLLAVLVVLPLLLAACGKGGGGY